MNRNVTIIVALVLVITGLGVYKFYTSSKAAPVACTMEAKICPDGSAVGRSGPNCAFAPCPEVNNILPEKNVLSEKDARMIAEETCIKGGGSLSAGTYNNNSKTWWYDANLNAAREGCNPACVVNEETKTAEINWRCTGLSAPADSNESGPGK